MLHGQLLLIEKQLSQSEMSAFKYVTPRGALRFLRTWALRVTPADQFNDPFEMHPSIDFSTSGLFEQAPAIVRKQLEAKFSEVISAQGYTAESPEGAALSDLLATFMMRQMSHQDEQAFLRSAHAADPGAVAALSAFRDNFSARYAEIMVDARAQLPDISRMAQVGMHQMVSRLMGVLCLSGSGKHPLMWAHYTDSHKGALLEFNEAAPCFHRRIDGDDECGALRRVCYSDTRPVVSDFNGSDVVAAFAFTKALEWAYEQELRLLWPLHLSDRRIDDGGATIHLLEVPPTALRSVTLGCKAEAAFIAEVVDCIAAVRDRAGIAVRLAAVDERSFSLNYRDLI